MKIFLLSLQAFFILLFFPLYGMPPGKNTKKTFALLPHNAGGEEQREQDLASQNNEDDEIESPRGKSWEALDITLPQQFPDEESPSEVGSREMSNEDLETLWQQAFSDLQKFLKYNKSDVSLFNEIEEAVQHSLIYHNSAEFYLTLAKSLSNEEKKKENLAIGFDYNQHALRIALNAKSILEKLASERSSQQNFRIDQTLFPTSQDILLPLVEQDFEGFDGAFDFENDPLFKTEPLLFYGHELGVHQRLSSSSTKQTTPPLIESSVAAESFPSELNKRKITLPEDISELTMPPTKKKKTFSLDPEIRACIVAVAEEAYNTFLKKPIAEQKQINDRKYLQSVIAREFTKHGIKSADGYQHISQITTEAKERVTPSATAEEKEQKIITTQALLEKLKTAQQQGMSREIAIHFVAEQQGRDACLKLFSENSKSFNKVNARPVLHNAICQTLTIFGVPHAKAASHAGLKATEIMRDLFPQNIVKELSPEAERLLGIFNEKKQNGMEEVEARISTTKEEAKAFILKMIAQDTQKNGHPFVKGRYRNALLIETSRILRDLGLASPVAFQQTSPIVTEILHEIFPKLIRENAPSFLADFEIAKNRGLAPRAASLEVAKKEGIKAYSPKMSRKEILSIIYHALMACKTMDSAKDAGQQAGFLTTELLKELAPPPEREGSREVLADFETAKNSGIDERTASLVAAKKAAEKAYDAKDKTRQQIVSVTYHAIMDCKTMKGTEAKSEATSLTAQVFQEKRT